MKHISRGAGRSATAAAAYRAASRIHDERTDCNHDYSAKRGVLSNTILAPSRVPEWAQDTEQLWNQVEQTETRKDARLARENIVALPHELTLEQNEEWLQRFVNENYVKRGMVAQISIHNADHVGDSRNIHAHILLTDRQVTRNGFKAKKVRSWNEKATLMLWRESFAEHQNRALEQHGHDARVDHRSHVDQGIAKEAQQHMGPAAKQEERSGNETDIGQRNRLAKEFNQNLEAMQLEAKKIEEQITNLENEALVSKPNKITSDVAKAFHNEAKHSGSIAIEKPAQSASDGVEPMPDPYPEDHLIRLDAERVKQTSQDGERARLEKENREFYKRDEATAKLKESEVALKKSDNFWGRISGEKKRLEEGIRVQKLNLESKDQRIREREEDLEAKLKKEWEHEFGAKESKQTDAQFRDNSTQQEVKDKSESKTVKATIPDSVPEKTAANDNQKPTPPSEPKLEPKQQTLRARKSSAPSVQFAQATNPPEPIIPDPKMRMDTDDNNSERQRILESIKAKSAKRKQNRGRSM